MVNITYKYSRNIIYKRTVYLKKNQSYPRKLYNWGYVPTIFDCKYPNLFFCNFFSI